MTLLELMQSVGIRLGDVVAGAAGGVVHAFVFSRQNPWSVIGSIVVGTLTATYLTETAARYMNTFVSVTDGTSGFIVGLCGMAICQGIMTGVKKWRPELKGGQPNDKPRFAAGVLDPINLTTVHVVVAFIGMMLSALAITTTVEYRNVVINHLYRAGYVFLGITFAWSYFYADARGWQPWPPHLGLMVAISYILAVRLARHFVLEKRADTVASGPHSATG